MKITAAPGAHRGGDATSPQEGGENPQCEAACVLVKHWAPVCL